MKAETKAKLENVQKEIHNILMNRVVRLITSGLSYDEALETVYDDMRKNYPVQFAAYIASTES